MNRGGLVACVRAAQGGNLRDFEILVHRFQDMAVGYSRGLLDDFHLAEDAAQDAFVLAHARLGQLQQAEAFPGWFRQIVFSCCMRYRQRRTQEAPSQDKIFTRKVLSKVEATCDDVVTALVGALHGITTAAGIDWSVARVNSLLGYSSHFCIKPEGGYTEHQSVIEWALFFGVLDRLGFETQHFEAYLADDGHSSDGTSIPKTGAEEEGKVREDTWHAVCGSIDRGIPAIAWSPMTVAQMEEGVHGYEWGLLVGYDEEQRTYTVHHRGCSNKPYTVPFDGFGHCDSQEWYYVITFGDHTPPAEPALVAAALKDAVAYANGTRYDKDACCYRVAGVGFEAYEVWRDALAKGLPDTSSIGVNANQLKINRQHAAIFLRESARCLGGRVAQALSDAAACYDMEVAAVAEVRDISRAACEEGELTAVHQREAVANVGAALAADRLAIGHIESALGLLV